MEEGYLQQFESPSALKNQPANLFTGTFIGEPPMNVFNATVTQESDEIRFQLDEDVFLSYNIADFTESVIHAALTHEEIVIGVRPYAVKRSHEGVKATVLVNQWLGDQTHIAAELAGQSIVLVEHDRAIDKAGENIMVRLAPESLHLFDCDSGAAISHGMAMA